MDGGAWQVFIAYPSAERAAADDLYRELGERGIRTFLDHKCLDPGDIWPSKLAEAQRAARITVVLVSARSAYFQQDEIARAITLLHEDAERHRVVPVYLDAAADPPYGLHGIQAIFVSEVGGMAGVADAVASLIMADTAGAGLVPPTFGAPPAVAHGEIPNSTRGPRFVSLRRVRPMPPSAQAAGPPRRRWSPTTVSAVVAAVVVALVLGVAAEGWIDPGPGPTSTLPMRPDTTLQSSSTSMAEPTTTTEQPRAITTTVPTPVAPTPDPPTQLPPETPEPQLGQWRPVAVDEVKDHCMATKTAGPNLHFQICWIGATPLMFVTVSGVTGQSPNHPISVPRIWTVVNGVHSRGTTCPLITARIGERLGCVDETGPSVPGDDVQSNGRLFHDSVETSLFTPRI